jgi:hypothetical protein
MIYDYNVGAILTVELGSRDAFEQNIPNHLEG